MDILSLDEELKQDKEPKPVCVVRLVTSCYKSGNILTIKKTIRGLARKSQGYQVLFEDADVMCPESVFDRITNLGECKDGIYRVEICNEFASWETPHIVEDYDYKLVKYEE